MGNKKKDKIEKCDLLEIYSHEEKTKLIQECQTNLEVLIKHEQDLNNINDNIGIEFIDDSIDNNQETNSLEPSSNCHLMDVNTTEIDFDEI